MTNSDKGLQCVSNIAKYLARSICFKLQELMLIMFSVGYRRNRNMLGLISAKTSIIVVYRVDQNK